ncbi:MAG TPA: hypothetical protein VM869_00115 [Enhygromyxa sp.]|nr:hypothetical protein [Enhygromyxa sp.]
MTSGCSSDPAREDPVDPSGKADTEPGEAGGSSTEVAWDRELEPGPMRKTSMREHPAGVAWVIDPEKLEEPRKLDIAQAEARGYTVIDLGDAWRPYIFTHKTPGVEDFGENVYAARYSDLANDRTDADGDPLAEHEHNHLEHYGIPPTLAVVLEEWRGLAEIEQCLSEAGYDGSHFDPSVGAIAYAKKAGAKRLKSWRWAKTKLEKDMRKAGLGEAVEAGNYAAAAELPDLKKSYEYFRSFDREVQIIRNAQIRFRCEKLRKYS